MNPFFKSPFPPISEPVQDDAPIPTVRKRRGPKPGDPRMVEAGRRGGTLILEERGREFFQQIGQKGGQATKAKYGAEFFSSIGRKGGETVARDYGPAFYAEIGRKGGSRRGKLSNKKQEIST